MKFSISAEKEAAVGIAENIAGNKIKPALDRSLGKV